MAVAMLRARKGAKSLAATMLVMPFLLAALASVRPQLCDTGTPLIGRQAYFDMLVRKVTADTNLANGVASALASMAEHIAREIVPMAILLPVGGVLVMSCRDANRDLCSARIGLVRTQNRLNICEVFGWTLGLCVVILALTHIIFTLVKHVRRRRQLREEAKEGEPSSGKA
mmetsp:Transcript_35697/g.70664  ORF Transcript_35697/g.70664 Transcript_35697/m.70664 type:complete len:171 (-) Transcript_35697:222-734(-)